MRKYQKLTTYLKFFDILVQPDLLKCINGKKKKTYKSSAALTSLNLKNEFKNWFVMDQPAIPPGCSTF